MTGACLLLRHDKAGDAIKTLPALRTLREADPNLETHILVSSHNASLFEHEPEVRIHVLPQHWHGLADEVLLTHLGHGGMPTAFSKVINLLCDPSAESDRLLKLFRATEKYSAHFDASLDGEVNRLTLPRNSPAKRDESMNILMLLGGAFDKDLLPLHDVGDKEPVLHDEDAREALTLMGEKDGTWLGFCPFAGLASRTHPIERWEAFLPQATRSPFVEKFFLFGAPGDCKRLEQLRERCYRPEAVQLCFPSSFRTLGAYLLRLDGVVAVDSGPLHLAHALDVRSLGILSGGDYKRWFATLGEGDRLVRRGLLNRFPTSLEMTWAFRRWLPQVTG